MDSDEEFYDIINDKDIKKNPELVEDTNTDNEQSDDSSDEEEAKTYTLDSPEYKDDLKLRLFGEPVHSKNNSSLYVLSSKKTKKFIENIKNHGNNLQIVKDHYKKIADELLKDENPELQHQFIVVEYTKLKTDDVKSLCELLDGHHRKRALTDIYKIKPNFKISITVRLIQSDMPDSSKTKILFRKLNIIKPFEVDFILSDKAILIVQELKNYFKEFSNFIIIKDNTEAKRPSIKQNLINDSILVRLTDLKNKFNINNNDINIKLIISNFVKYNTKIKEHKLYLNNKQKISENTIEKAHKINFFLGLVNLDKLVKECIGEEYD